MDITMETLKCSASDIMELEKHEIEGKSNLTTKIISAHKHRRNEPYKQHFQALNEQKLITAAITNNIDTVHELLAAGVAPNCSDKQKRTPLHFAASKGYEEIVKILLKFGANPNTTDSIGNTALHLATCTHKVGIVFLLIMHGSNVLLTDRNGLNPLQISIGKLKLCEQAFKKMGENSDYFESYRKAILEINKIILHSFKQQQKDMTDLLEVEKRFNKLTTQEEMNEEVNNLLATLEKVSLQKT